MKKIQKKNSKNLLGKRDWEELDSIDHFNMLEKAKVVYAEKIAKMLQIQDLESEENISKIWEEKQKHGKNDKNLAPSKSQKEIEKHANIYNFEDYLSFKGESYHKNFVKKFSSKENNEVEKFLKMIDSHLCSVNSSINPK